MKNKIKIDIERFSEVFNVRKLNVDNLEEIYNLCKMNTFYYEHCPPFVTKQSILKDMELLPPKKSIEDKYYIGYFDGNRLIAVMDFINAYPFDDFCFIGFFMLDIKMQNKGLGSAIIDELLQYISKMGFKGVRLAWVETNYKAEKFWKNKGFSETGDKNITDEYTGVIAERSLWRNMK